MPDFCSSEVQNFEEFSRLQVRVLKILGPEKPSSFSDSNVNKSYNGDSDGLVLQR